MNPFVFLVDNMMIPILQFFFNLTNNYVIAIILLTFVIKLVLFPFTIKQVRAMDDMKKIQPKLKEVQTKYKDNPQQLQIQMMSLYKEHNVNPFGSCLPTLIQLPFFVAIFMSLNSPTFRELILAVDPSQASFLWINNLIGPDSTVILPILVAISTWLSQKTMTMSTDPNDPTQKMFKFMPFLMLFISINMPSGVLVYWSLSQLMTGAQQYWLTSKKKEIEEMVATEPVTIDVVATPVKPKKQTNQKSKSKKGVK
ncbi:MAG: YidC/Oxa1 family membrane protein insertase [Candidatus Margulisbacteria bacterium]|nr:YidC/Oxa1 family membrane protein insertase [Candidatus Margulisiibacteriota bacterium]